MTVEWAMLARCLLLSTLSLCMCTGKPPRVERAAEMVEVKQGVRVELGARDGDDVETYTCSGGGCTVACTGSCKATCSGGGCNHTCAAGATCEFTCAGGGCNEACAAGSNCQSTCSGGGCNRACADPGCTATCSGGGCNG